MAVAARGLAFRYRRGRGSAGPAAVGPLDLRVDRGDVVGLLGPNGAGKSTLLRLLATALPPTAGSLVLLDRDARDPAPALRRRIGYAAEEPVHLDPLSGRENALFFARATGMRANEAAAAVHELLTALGLADDAGRPAGEYSYGTRRKLLLVCALVHSPDLVLLDEPTNGLDLRAREALRDRVRARARSGAAFVLATHDVAEARRLCDRVVFLHHGRVVLEGAPDELIERAGAGTVIDVALANGGLADTDLRIAGATVIHARDDGLTVRTRDGTALLPALCAALVDRKLQIRAIRIREADLGDVFQQATGLHLEREP